MQKNWSSISFLPIRASLYIFLVFMFFAMAVMPFVAEIAVDEKLQALDERTKYFANFVLVATRTPGAVHSMGLQTEKYVADGQEGRLFIVPADLIASGSGVWAAGFLMKDERQPVDLLWVLGEQMDKLLSLNAEGQLAFRQDLLKQPLSGLVDPPLHLSLSHLYRIIISNSELVAISREGTPDQRYLVTFVNRSSVISFLKTLVFKMTSLLLVVGLLLTCLVNIYLTHIVRSTISSVANQVHRGLEEEAELSTLSPRQSIQDIRDELGRDLVYQSRMASLGTNASYMAHDVRNMLASLQLTAERLSSLGGEKERSIAKSLMQTIDKGVMLLEWAQTFAHENFHVAKKEKVYLLPVIEEVRELALAEAGDNPIDFVVECSPELSAVTDRNMLFRVIFNLSNNSVKALKKKTGFLQIRILAYQDNQGICLYFSDTGAGFGTDAARRMRSFNDAQSFKGEGGLGLKIAHDFVHTLEGAIEVIRSDESGTHFLITLPHQDVAFESLDAF
ncbi:HAMP domain-containing histidine kinase [Alphaproteobacteria bacterium]|nr:HAMP domain-containing histidine kinase [Alphaproteobacteria bacterium]